MLATALCLALGIEAVDLGPLFRGGDNRVLGMDGAFSVPVAPGSSLWVFGDTLLGSWKPDGGRLITGMPSCTAAVVEDRDWVTGFAHARLVPSQMLRETGLAKGHRRWPLDLLAVGRDRWLFYVEIAVHGTGLMDFSVAGTGAAKLDHGVFKPWKMLWGKDAPTYGSSVMVHDGYTYLYASGATTYLARAKTGSFDFSYWDGRGFSAKAAGLPASGPEASVRWNPYLKAFVMVYVPMMGHEVVMRTAPDPWGPWSEPQKLLGCLPADANVYGGKQHVELDQDRGRRIVITYNTNGSKAQLADRPDVYWPRAARVTFTR
ncbi:MAG: hypothetical protein JWM80_910 [Cyanobacteria bacterium RYN_339]|nr:hypothetical protein [Cyanobacteria bacterium RYN_339]